jgi:hypothetical protein
MPFPSPSRLESFLRAYEGPHGHTFRVWGVDAGPNPSVPPSMEDQVFGHPPRLVLLGASEDGIAVVRQTNESMRDLDGIRVPWSSVKRLERDPHLVRDLVRVELAGRSPLLVAISNHVLLPHNRFAAKGLCDLVRPPATARSPYHDRASLLASDGADGLLANPT